MLEILHTDLYLADDEYEGEEEDDEYEDEYDEEEKLEPEETIAERVKLKPQERKKKTGIGLKCFSPNKLLTRLPM